MIIERDENHVYRVDGLIVPGVSQILKETHQSKDWSEVPEFYRDRGLAVHEAVKLWVKGTLDEESLDPAILPYFRQFQEWFEENKINSLSFNEASFYSPTLRYCGTIDFIADADIWDMKCSKKLDKNSLWQYSLQGAAYRQLVLENLRNVMGFKILLLTGTGKAQQVDVFCPSQAWQAVVELYDWKTGRKT